MTKQNAMPNHGRSRRSMPSPVEDRPVFLDLNPLPNTTILKIETHIGS